MTVNKGAIFKEEANQEPNMYGVVESHVSKTAGRGAPGRFLETENKFPLTGREPRMAGIEIGSNVYWVVPVPPPPWSIGIMRLRAIFGSGL